MIDELAEVGHGGGDPLHQRSVRSYVVRASRMTTAQRRAIEQLWPQFGIDATPALLDLDATFGRVAPRTLEIGFGNGDHLAMLASANPQRDFLGVEVHPPGVGHLLQRAAASGLGNLRVIRHDAVEVLERQIGAATLEEILVLFPDPWPKKRHHKRRLVEPRFASLAASKLRPGGVLRLATDWTPYAQQMAEVLGAEPLLVNLAADGAYMPRNMARPPTRFERRGESLGHEVHDLAFRRVAAPIGINADCAAAPRG